MTSSFRHPGGLWTVVLVMVCAPTSAVLAGPREFRALDTCVPADAMAAYFARPSPAMLEAEPGGTVDQIAGWLVTFKAMGIIPREGRVIADVVATLPVLARRPHALVLLDITSKEIRPDVYRLNDMQAALVIDGEGMSIEIERRLRDLLGTYTEAQAGTIEIIHIGDVTYHQLVDTRLPPWAVVSWGEVGRQFVVAFGAGAFERMLSALNGQARTLGDDAWFQQAHRRCRGASSGIEVFVDLARITRRVGEVVEDRPEAVLGALGVQQADRLVWTVGFDDRALRSEILARQSTGQDDYAMLTGREVTAPAITASIPPEAGKYAVFRFPLGQAVLDGRSAYLNSQSAGAQQRLREGWSNLEENFDFNVQTGLIEHLGQHLVVHNYPRHPLRLPVGTIWFQLDGDGAEVEKTVDRMMAAWQHQMNKPAATRPSISLSPRIEREPGGLWYVQLGLIQPAIAVTDEWIVIGFSPEAVRMNLAHLGGLKAETRP